MKKKHSEREREKRRERERERERRETERRGKPKKKTRANMMEVGGDGCKLSLVVTSDDRNDGPRLSQ